MSDLPYSARTMLVLENAFTCTLGGLGTVPWFSWKQKGGSFSFVFPAPFLNPFFFPVAPCLCLVLLYTLACVPFPFTNIRIWNMVNQVCFMPDCQKSELTKSLNHLVLLGRRRQYARSRLDQGSDIHQDIHPGQLRCKNENSSERVSCLISSQVTWNLFPVIFFLSIDGWIPVDIVEPMWACVDWIAKMVFSSSLMEANFFTAAQRKETSRALDAKLRMQVEGADGWREDDIQSIEIVVP